MSSRQAHPEGTSRRRLTPVHIPLAVAAWVWAAVQRLAHSHRIRRDTESVLPELVAVACFLVLLWASIAVAIKHEYDTALSTAAQTTANLARAFEESTRR